MIRFGLLFYLAAVLGFQPPDSLILTPDLQGAFSLEPEITLVLGYGTVAQPTRFAITSRTTGLWVDFQPALESTMIPMLLTYREKSFIIDSPGSVQPIPSGQYMIYFDTIGVFAQHETLPDTLYFLGMIETYRADFPVKKTRPGWQVEAKIEPGGQH